MEPFLSEIRIMSFNFPPKGWALCNGQLLPINQNQALFALLGTTFGGNGQTNFALPNLRGRVPIHEGNGHTRGEAAGSTSVTLSVNQIPPHLHNLQVMSTSGNTAIPGGSMLAESSGTEAYRAPSSLTTLDAGSVGSVGGTQPHTNMQPYTVLSFCIALQGLFPSQN